MEAVCGMNKILHRKPEETDMRKFGNGLDIACCTIHFHSCSVRVL